MALKRFEEQKENKVVETKVEPVTPKKTVGETIQMRLQKVEYERAEKTEQLFELIRNLYLENSDLVFMKIRIAEVTSKGLFPELKIEFFDRKAKKLPIRYNKLPNNEFTDFEGDDFTEFVNMAKAQGLKVLFDKEEKNIKEEPVRRLYLCILPEVSTLDNYYVNKVFRSTPYEIKMDEFYDFISEEAVYIPEAE